MPAAIGAAAEVPPWRSVHTFLPTSVVCFLKKRQKVSLGSSHERKGTDDRVTAPGTVSHDHDRRAGFRVVRVEAFAVDGADGDRHEAVGVAVEVALIVVGAPVPARKDVDAALAGPPVLDAVKHRLDDETTGSLHRLAVVGRAPAARVDGVRLEAVVER